MTKISAKGKKREVAEPMWPLGHWRVDGSWATDEDDEQYVNAPPGSITRGVRQLVWLRRNQETDPRRMAILIEAHHLGSAFPSRDQWLDCGEWQAAETQTSAEAAVKYAGLGTEPRQFGPGTNRKQEIEKLLQGF